MQPDTPATPPEPEDGQRPRPRRRWLLRVLLALGMLLCLGVLDYYAYPRCVTPGGVSGDSGENGIWLRYTWYFGEWDDTRMADLATRLREGHMRDAFFHVRFVERDGRLHFRYPDRARRLTDAVHRAAPGVRAVAWVYLENTPGRDWQVNLAAPEARRAMIEEARMLVAEGGFDGIQWDYEPCPDGDGNFLALLRESRAALPAGTFLSVASPPHLAAPLRPVWGWSEAYFSQVAALCDQIAVMQYDTAMPLPRSYVWLTRRQVWRVTRAVAAGNPACHVLIGVPTYEDRTRAHNPHVERLVLALKGVREGLQDPRTARGSFAGVALFADYTTDEAEWHSYRQWWAQ